MAVLLRFRSKPGGSGLCFHLEKKVRHLECLTDPSVLSQFVIIIALCNTCRNL